MLKRIPKSEAAVAFAQDNKARPVLARARAFASAEARGERCKYLQRRATPRLRTRRSGFSLIEVVIALGVFLFGALAIVRIFPGALGTIQTSERRNVAQRMNQSTLARYTSAPLTVPEAIADVNPDNYNQTANETGWNDFAGSVYGTATRNESLPRNPPAPDDISFDNSSTVSTQLTKSAAGRFRRIIGEEHVVTQETIGGIARGVITLRYPYLLFPNVAVAPITDNIIATHQLRFYQTYAVEGVTVNKAGALDFTNATSPDYTAASGNKVNDTTDPSRPNTTDLRIAGVSAPNKESVTFYVSYRWSESGRINSVADEPKRFPNATGWAAMPVGPTIPQSQVLMGVSGRQIVEGPVQVKIKRYLSSTGAPSEVDSSLGRAIISSTTGTTLVGQRVTAEYSVPDWRMIVHDDNLSTTLSTSDQDYLKEQDSTYSFGTSGTIANARVTTVPTKFITEDEVSQNATLANRPAQAYAMVKGTDATGVVRSTSAAWSPDKFTTPSRISYNNPPAAGDGRAVGLRPKSGQVFFDVSNLAAPSGRVVFRNVDGWLEQPSVAARSYVPYVNRTGIANPEWWPREPWREYFWNKADDALYFHPSEVGKTVLATYQYEAGIPAALITMRDVPLTVRENLVPQPPALNGTTFALPPNSTVTDVQASRAYFVADDGGCIGAAASGDTDVQPPQNPKNNGAKIVAILSIKGASIRVRSAWFDGSRYSQNDVSGYRSLDVESNSRS